MSPCPMLAGGGLRHGLNSPSHTSRATLTAAPLITAEWTYAGTIEPLPLFSPSSSRDPISISTSPVEIA
jgi:hypothetical protein